jgi:hypothetical protein
MSTAVAWEYLVVPIEYAGRMKKHADLRPDHLNELGVEGWEVFGMTLKKGWTSWPGRSSS